MPSIITFFKAITRTHASNLFLHLFHPSTYNYEFYLIVLFYIYFTVRQISREGIIACLILFPLFLTPGSVQEPMQMFTKQCLLKNALGM